MTTNISASERLAESELTASLLRESIGQKIAAGESFDSDAIALAAVVASHREILKESNAAAVAEETSKLAATIYTIVGATPLAELLGEDVASIYWTYVPASTEAEAMLTCVINPKARVAASRTTNGNGTRGSRRTPRFTVDGSEEMSAAEFVATYASDDIQENSLVKADADGKRKWASKPAFVEATKKLLEETGRVVVQIDPAS